MTRLDWIVLLRVAARVGITFAVFFGIAALAVSLDLGRFGELSRIGGPLLGLSGIVTSALRTSVSVLPIVVLIGTIIGVLDLQARREMTIIKSSGASIWQVARAPLYAAIILGLFIGLIGQTLVLDADRYIDEGQSHGDGIWLEQKGKDGDFVLELQRRTVHQVHALPLVHDQASAVVEAELHLAPVPAPCACVTRIEQALHDVAVGLDPAAQPIQTTAAIAVCEEHEGQASGLLRRQA